MTTAPAPPAPSLVELLTQQRDLYRELKSLSDQQTSLIADGRADELLALLAQRQRLVDRLTHLNGDLTAARDRGEAEDRERVRSLMDEVDGLLHQIIEQDDRDRKDLQASQQQVGQQIQRVRQGGAAMSAYRAAPSVPAVARFTDRRG